MQAVRILAVLVLLILSAGSGVTVGKLSAAEPQSMVTMQPDECQRTIEFWQRKIGHAQEMMARFDNLYQITGLTLFLDLREKYRAEIREIARDAGEAIKQACS